MTNKRNLLATRELGNGRVLRVVLSGVASVPNDDARDLWDKIADALGDLECAFREAKVGAEPRLQSQSSSQILSVDRKADGDVVVSFDRRVYEDPAAWGVILADVVRDLAKGSAPIGALRHGDALTEPQQQAALRILELFDAELADLREQRKGLEGSS